MKALRRLGISTCLCVIAFSAFVVWPSEKITTCGPQIEERCGEPLCFCKGSHTHANGAGTGRRTR